MEILLIHPGQQGVLYHQMDIRYK